MANKKSAIELETVIIFIIALVVLAVVIFIFANYGGAMYHSIKEHVINTITLSKETMPKKPAIS